MKICNQESSSSSILLLNFLSPCTHTVHLPENVKSRKSQTPNKQQISTNIYWILSILVASFYLTWNGQLHIAEITRPMLSLSSWLETYFSIFLNTDFYSRVISPKVVHSMVYWSVFLYYPNKIMCSKQIWPTDAKSGEKKSQYHKVVKWRKLWQRCRLCALIMMSYIISEVIFGFCVAELPYVQILIILSLIQRKI